MSVCADALYILFDFCAAKMAQFCNCARLVLTHALLLIFGKASLGFLVDSVIVLESVKLDSESELLNLESKPTRDSVFSLHSTLGLPVKLSCAEHPESRPLRGVQSLAKGGRSASATIALEAEVARHSPRLSKKTQRVASEAQQKSGALSFWAGESGERGNPFFFCANKRF